MLFSKALSSATARMHAPDASGQETVLDIIITARTTLVLPHKVSDWAMMQGVWASKYNERAFLSMKKVGLNFLDLRMAVLVQRVVPAAYAFVIHTENPTNGAKDEIFAELVKGLGESIVSGMVPGSSLSFFAKKDSLDKPEV